MSARDRYTTPIECPKCKLPGVLHLSEEDGYAYMRNQAVKVEHVEGEFKAVGQPSGEVNVTCNKCGSTFVIKP